MSVLPWRTAAGAMVAGLAAATMSSGNGAGVLDAAPRVRTEVLVAPESVWSIYDRRKRPRSAWRELTSPGPGWRRGATQAGFGEGDEVTKLRRKRITYYLRKRFQVADPARVERLRLRALIDDGAAFFLNGRRVARKNLARDAGHRTPATRRVNGERERRWTSFRLPPTLLRAGRNVLAAEVHNAGDRDLSFDARLVQRVTDPADQPDVPPPPARPGPPDVTRVMCRIDHSQLREISGLASSVHFPGILWTHNDKGDSARVFGIDANTCAIRAVVTLAGVRAVDFEAISMGRNAAGEPELWVGDIGDNDRARGDVRLYRFREPATLRNTTVSPRTVRVTWSDGARNAESLIVAPVPNGRVFLVSKEVRSGIYRLRGEFRATGVATTGARIGSTRSMATDAATAPDRSLTVIRFGNTGTVLRGLPGSSPRNFAFPTQRQGEAVTFSQDGRHLFIATEGVGDLIRIPLNSL